MDIELVVYDACMMYIVSPLAGLAGGGGILWRPPAYSLFFLSKENLLSLLRNIHGRIRTRPKSEISYSAQR